VTQGSVPRIANRRLRQEPREAILAAGTSIAR
jgi:hypothetical protein